MLTEWGQVEPFFLGVIKSREQPQKGVNPRRNIEREEAHWQQYEQRDSEVDHESDEDEDTKSTTSSCKESESSNSLPSVDEASEVYLQRETEVYRAVGKDGRVITRTITIVSALLQSCLYCLFNSCVAQNYGKTEAEISKTVALVQNLCSLLGRRPHAKAV